MLSWIRVKKPLKRRSQIKKNTTYLNYKEEARSLILARLDFYNQAGHFSYNRVSIRDQKRCWGSCSSKGNLNFSYKLLFLPTCLRDYIIVHELSHLRVLNHSTDFWSVVESQLPDYVVRLQTLRQLELTVGTSLKALKNHQAQHNCIECAQALSMVK